MKTLAILTVLLGCALAGTAAAQWAGTEVKENGVLHVKNPETPVTTVRVEPKVLWERGGEDDELFFGNLAQIVHDKQGNVYVLDSQLTEILVFSPGGELLRTLGREGEGPGEFMNASDMYMGPDGVLGVVSIFPGKIFQIGTDGTPMDNFPLPDAGGYQLVHRARANADRVLIVTAINSGQPPTMTQSTTLKAFDGQGKELAQYCEVKVELRFGGMTFEERNFNDYARRWELAADGRVAVNLSFDDYTINVYKPDGSIDRVIERPDHKTVKRSKKDFDRFQKLFDALTRWNPGSTFNVSETHGAVGNLWFRPDGNLWVLSNRATYDRPEGSFAGIDEFDRAGRFQRRIDLVLDGDPVEDGLFIVGDRLYLVTDLFGAVMASIGGGDSEEDAEEGEPLRLIAHDLSSETLGMR